MANIKPRKCAKEGCPKILTAQNQRRCDPHAAERRREICNASHKRRRQARQGQVCALPGCNKPARTAHPNSCCSKEHSHRFQVVLRNVQHEKRICDCGKCGQVFIPYSKFHVYAPDCPYHAAIMAEKSRARCHKNYQAHPLQKQEPKQSAKLEVRPKMPTAKPAPRPVVLSKAERELQERMDRLAMKAKHPDYDPRHPERTEAGI